MRKTRSNSHPQQPHSLEQAFGFCQQHALAKRNRGAERIAELMGVPVSTYYRWLADVSMPAARIPAFEEVCGIDYVSRYLATSRGSRVVIDIPVGRKAGVRDLNALQGAATAAVGQLIRFYDGESNETEVLAAIQAALEGFVFQRENVKKLRQPEFDFGGDSND